jgi:hypothetical protein
VTVKRGRSSRKLLDDLTERRGYPRLKEEAIDRTMLRARFGRCFEPVVEKYYLESRSRGISYTK